MVIIDINRTDSVKIGNKQIIQAIFLACERKDKNV